MNPSPEFYACWERAADHLGGLMEGQPATWIKSEPVPAWHEHLSFKLGNQLFFIRLVDHRPICDVTGSPRQHRRPAHA